jgi:quercetin dioxygenase-like cupin family protein
MHRSRIAAYLIAQFQISVLSRILLGHLSLREAAAPARLLLSRALRAGLSRPTLEMAMSRSRVIKITIFSLLLCMLKPLPQVVAEQPGFVVTPVAEKTIDRLPPGPLFWRVQNFRAIEEAQAAEEPTSLAAEIAGEAWLFTLGPMGATHPGTGKTIVIGPVPLIAAPKYLLRINRATATPGAKTAIHTHPGSEAFYVLAGQVSQRTPHGVKSASAGQSMPGHGAGTPMEVSSTGTTDLNALVMFVVDATKPFSSPANFE